MLDRTLLIIVLLFANPATGAERSLDAYDVDPETGLRMERYRAPVPADIPGGLTLATEQLADMQRQGTAVLIDVHPPKGLGPDPLDGHWVTSEIRQSIPGSIWLPEVGRGSLSLEAEDYFKRNIARLSRNRLDAPLVFFCNADCWQSWNAARRAIVWGYSAVYWYPLGTDGWLEDGRELTRIQPVNFFDDTTPAVPEEAASVEEADQQFFPDSATIHLIDRQGAELALGTVRFTPSDAGFSTFAVELDSERLVDQFLSMRPFRCLTDPAEWFCHLPYPYKLQGRISADDLTELEYQLLFIWKSPGSFGIDFWNGVYYQLAWQDDGSLRGTLLQGDLNVLADPPPPYSHPIDLNEFTTEDARSRRFPSLFIRP
ncbi:rhodanese-like domain-containing protein [Granulosicoccus sp. 3-233]|uniref:rhodanese-like domain-containing protein n=1 Tax=Granulosicoccus sp. 3-233 TaxID=3417969 RepID=UPI003D332203